MVLLGQGSDSFTALRFSKTFSPDIIILNLGLDFFHGIEVSRLVNSNSPKTSVVLISSRIDGTMLKRSFKGKAAAYLLKEDDMENLAVILRKVNAGETYVNPRIGMWALESLEESLPENRKGIIQKRKLPKLNHKEIKIIRFIGQGQTDKEMAGSLRLKNGTVRNYVSNLMRRTGLKNRAQLVHFAIVNGFVDAS